MELFEARRYRSLQLLIDRIINIPKIHHEIYLEPTKTWVENNHNHMHLVTKESICALLNELIIPSLNCHLCSHCIFFSLQGTARNQQCTYIVQEIEGPHTPLGILIKPTIGCKIFWGRYENRLNLAFHSAVLIASSVYPTHPHRHPQKKKKHKNKCVSAEFSWDPWLFLFYYGSALLTIIRRKWQCKPPSSDKHMNTWIYEWEP